MSPSIRFATAALALAIALPSIILPDPSAATPLCLTDGTDPFGFPCPQAVTDSLRQPDSQHQPDSLRQAVLETLHVRATRLNEPELYQPVRVERFSANDLRRHQGHSVSELLERFSSMHIRDNGPGGMSLASQRGLSPSQSQVLWEGFPIHSLSLGQTDLSLLPADLFESVEVGPGTPSSAFGAGALGGNLYLSSMRDRNGPTVRDRPSLEAGIHAGAFGRRSLSLNGQTAAGQSALRAAALLHRARNDFSYRDRFSGETRRRTGNSGNGGQLILGGERELPAGSLTATLWAWGRQEGIPGTVLNPSDETRQQDSGVRLVTGLNRRAGSWRLNPSLFLERTRFTYEDPSGGIDSRLASSRVLTSLQAGQTTERALRWRGGASGGFERVETGNYAGNPQRILMALWANPVIRMPGTHLRLYPAVRFDSTSDFGQVISPSFGFNLGLLPDLLHLHGAVSRDFNPPSFNDLYWTPGGNPDLRPERSFRTEAGLAWKPEVSPLQHLGLTLYRLRLQDGIYWTPTGGAIWSPQNIQSVQAWGVESSLRATASAGPVGLLWSAGADLRRAEIASPRFSGDQAVGRQMRYIPQWSLRSSLEASRGALSLLASWNWTGRRWTSGDHTTWLPAWQRTDLSLAWQAGFSTLRISVRNLLDETYEIIEMYPMPGRHAEVSWRLHLPTGIARNRAGRTTQP